MIMALISYCLTLQSVLAECNRLSTSNISACLYFDLGLLQVFILCIMGQATLSEAMVVQSLSAFAGVSAQILFTGNS